MDLQLLISNLTNPTLLFFILGFLATVVKSDLEIPAQSIKFISLYLLFSIGFKGGQELVHNPFNQEVILSLVLGLVVTLFIPIYVFFWLKKRLSVANAAALAATYGSVSTVTFVTAVSFLELQQVSYQGHMVAVMALMEFPSIIVAVLLMKFFQKNSQSTSLSSLLHHSLTNGSVMMIVGSLVIGILADSKQAEGIKPFTTDIFKGFLALFLLDMGMTTARKIRNLAQFGKSVFAQALLFPLINGVLGSFLMSLVSQDVGNRFLFAVLCASASYIAVPAAMRLVAPDAEEGLYIPMALGLTFPFNITLGMPLYFYLAQVL